MLGMRVRPLRWTHRAYRDRVVHLAIVARKEYRITEWLDPSIAERFILWEDKKYTGEKTTTLEAGKQIAWELYVMWLKETLPLMLEVRNAREAEAPGKAPAGREGPGDSGEKPPGLEPPGGAEGR